MNAFLSRCERRQDEQVLDYSLRLDQEVAEAEQVAGEIAPHVESPLALEEGAVA